MYSVDFDDYKVYLVQISVKHGIWIKQAQACQKKVSMTQPPKWSLLSDLVSSNDVANANNFS